VGLETHKQGGEVRFRYLGNQILHKQHLATWDQVVEGDKERLSLMEAKTILLSCSYKENNAVDGKSVINYDEKMILFKLFC